jgi:hypothetical protein
MAMILYLVFATEKNWCKAVFECCRHFYFPCACKRPVKQLYISINMLDRIKQWLIPFGVCKVDDGVNFFNVAENPNDTSYNQCIISHHENSRYSGRGFNKYKNTNF